MVLERIVMMKNKLVYILLFLSLSSCISEFEFEAEPQSFTIISGVITNSTGERTIKVTRTTGLDSLVSAVEASGAVYKNGELEAELVPIKTGELVMPLSVNIEAGASYHIEVRTQEKVYKSKPITVPQKSKTDSLSFAIEERIDGFSSVGAPIRSWYVDVFAHFSPPASGDGTRYYKWHVDEAWSVVSALNICYLIEPVTENEVIVVNSDDVAGNKAAVRITTANLNMSFLQKHYFNVYLHAIDRTSFSFYEKAQRLINNSGTLFDEVPAPIPGNIYVDSGEQEDVLGWVEFSLVDTIRLPISRPELGLRIYDQCSSPFPCGGNGPCVCTDCAAVYGFATRNKPFYWE